MEVLTCELVEAIRLEYVAGLASQHDLATRLGITRQAVSQIVRGKTWQKAGGPILTMEAHNTLALSADLWISPTTRRRFWSKVEKMEDCWPWKSAYTSFWIPTLGALVNAPRVAFFLQHGALGSEEEACHTCDNPICCNGAHLFRGSHADNMADMARKRRGTLGVRNSHAKLNPGDVIAIRAAFESGASRAELALAYPVKPPQISRIVSGARWQHLTNPN